MNQVNKYNVEYRRQLEEKCKSTEFPQHEGKQGYYSYEDRYLFKAKDPSKKRFCSDPKISKEYERTLYIKFNEFN